MTIDYDAPRRRVAELDAAALALARRCVTSAEPTGATCPAGAAIGGHRAPENVAPTRSRKTGLV